MSAHPEHGAGRWWRRLIVFDYYLAVVLLLAAGLIKLVRPGGVGELLQSLWEQGFLSLDAMLAIARWQPWGEIALALAALSGWRVQGCARTVGTLYLFFALLIGVAADGYWTQPLDCGCFGSGGQTPVYLLVARNLLIALPLFFADASLGRRTLPALIRRR